MVRDGIRQGNMYTAKGKVYLYELSYDNIRL